MRTVKDGDFVKVHYTGKYDNGEVFDSSSGCKPLEVHVGHNEVIPGFESALLEMGINDKKTFTIGSSDAYGDRDDSLEQSFKRADFPEDFNPNLGDVIVLESEQQGQFPATVKSLDTESVLLDLNHPLAGKDLPFEVEVVEINDQATASACGCGCSCT
jgi:peptidylprolyl isomerase